MLATEPTMLPKLNGGWRPSDSRVMTSDARGTRKNGGRVFHGTKPSRKISVPSSSRARQQNDNKLMERQKTIAFPLSSRSSSNKDQNNNDNNISIRRLIAINGNIQDRKISSSNSPGYQDKTTTTAHAFGVNGVGLKTRRKVSSTQMQNEKNVINNKRTANTNELIAPLLNAFQDENNADSAHYKRLLNRNSFLSSNKPSNENQHKQQTTSKPKLVTRFSLDETVTSSSSVHPQQQQQHGLTDYLRRENLRYAQNELSVKKILFDNWLHNIQFVEFEDDKSSIAFSIPTSLPACVDGFPDDDEV